VPSGADFTIICIRGGPKPSREYGEAALFRYGWGMQIANITEIVYRKIYGI
jgi:hypothetical protein